MADALRLIQFSDVTRCVHVYWGAIPDVDQLFLVTELLAEKDVEFLMVAAHREQSIRENQRLTYCSSSYDLEQILVSKAASVRSAEKMKGAVVGSRRKRRKSLQKSRTR